MASTEGSVSGVASVGVSAFCIVGNKKVDYIKPMEIFRCRYCNYFAAKSFANDAKKAIFCEIDVAEM